MKRFTLQGEAVMPWRVTDPGRTLYRSAQRPINSGIATLATLCPEAWIFPRSL